MFKKDEYEESRNLYKDRDEVDILATVLKSGDKSVLAHPLTESFLTLKYLEVGGFGLAVHLYAMFSLFQQTPPPPAQRTCSKIPCLKHRV